jgi:subtilisin family serine protease
VWSNVWRDATGRGVRVAVVDSGIHAEHPHVGSVAGGIAITDDGVEIDTTDRVGHGTAVAGAIREKAPEAELFAVKVFDRALSTTVSRIVRAIRWSADAGAHIINLSLGTQRAEHAATLSAAVAYAAGRGSLVVAAAESDGIAWLPGSLPGVLAVRLDWSCPRDRVRVIDSVSGPRVFASGFPRPIPGVPPDANLKGISFAVANTAGIAALACESRTFPEELDIFVKRFTEFRYRHAAAPPRPSCDPDARPGVA